MEITTESTRDWVPYGNHRRDQSWRRMCWSRTIDLGFFEMGYPSICLGGLSFLGGIAKSRGGDVVTELNYSMLSCTLCKISETAEVETPNSRAAPPRTFLTPLSIAPLSLNALVEPYPAGFPPVVCLSLLDKFVNKKILFTTCDSFPISLGTVVR